MSSSYTRNTELRNVQLKYLFNLAVILDDENYWQTLMEIISKEINNQTFGTEDLENFFSEAAYERKYSNDHIRLIESAIRRPGESRLYSQILFDEWSSSGRKHERPTLGILLHLLVQSKLFRAADFVAELLNEPKPPRPNNGPAAEFEFKINVFKDIEETVNDTRFYPNTEDLQENANIDINKDFYTKYHNNVNKKIPPLNDNTEETIMTSPKPPPRLLKSARILKQKELLQKQQLEQLLVTADKTNSYNTDFSSNEHHHHNNQENSQSNNESETVLSSVSASNIPKLSALRNTTNSEITTTNCSFENENMLPKITALHNSFKYNAQTFEADEGCNLNSTTTLTYSKPNIVDEFDQQQHSYLNNIPVVVLSKSSSTGQKFGNNDEVLQDLPAISALNLNGERDASAQQHHIPCLELNRCNMSIKSSNGSISSPSISSESDVIAFQEVPLTALSKKTLQTLSYSLNSKKIFRSEEGYERDWRGLACLAEQKCLCDDNSISLEDPTKKVIQLWCKNNPTTATFAHLEQFLGTIDRWDVSDDIHELLVEDTKTYQTKQQHSANLKSDENVEMCSFNGNFGHGSDPNILTKSDVIRAQKGLPPQIYDAFVLFADADLNYASEMLTKLENNPEYDFKLCMKDRDLLAGVQFQHMALTQLIEERCKHLIVILTEEFLKSPENKFLVNYAQTLQIQHETRKIIPLLYEDNVNIPRTLKIYTLLRYKSSTSSLYDFWSKLADSIRNVNTITDTTTSSFNRSSTLGSSIASTSVSNEEESQLNESLSQHNEIPSITIIQSESNEKPIQKKTLKFKALSMRTQGRQDLLKDDIVPRNAHSTGQYKANNTISMSDLSTASNCSDEKNKKKWSTKLKKVFSRSRI